MKEGGSRRGDKRFHLTVYREKGKGVENLDNKSLKPNYGVTHEKEGRDHHSQVHEKNLEGKGNGRHQIKRRLVQRWNPLKTNY